MLRVTISSSGYAREGDLEQLNDASLVDDDGLETVVTISLFTDALATEDELKKYGLPQRGYWFDAYDPDPNLNTGSKLWLLEGQTITADTLTFAKTACDEALAWMVAEGAASRVENTVTRLGDDGIAGETVIYQPTDPRSPYRLTWEAHFAV